jgi:hypothetical protein
MSSNLPVGPERSGTQVASAGEFPAPYSLHDVQGAMAPPEQGGLDLRRYLAALLRYKWWIVATVVLGTAAGVGVSTRIKPEYEAQATMWVEVTPQREAAMGPIRAG